ncbi:methyltransferase domain-containing protein [Haloferax profundi]|uniref:XRE family transcriptional regulator n=1 Tax=Haloferax profundi TaxID=1544718 RepID=A0A0W1SV44_9EURY|nr:methyltransferase domain-containing protein [Haloferax profundi]KTG30266.1 XRE family transcriptional regulator [Haloferax profundi]
MRFEELQRIYDGDEYYWGTEPNGLATRVADAVSAETHPSVVDVGAGEGRDAVYFAEQGFDTTAIDIAPNGLDKAERLAADRGVELDTRRGDVNDLTFDSQWDLVYSIGTLQYIRPENRASQFEHFRDATQPGGVHAVWAFVDHPDVAPAPDWGDNEYLYDPGELRSYYDGWAVLHADDYVFDDDSAGEPHQHACEELILQKPE